MEGQPSIRGHKSGAAVWGPELRVKVLGSRFWDQGWRQVRGLRFLEEGSRVRVWGPGTRMKTGVQGPGFRRWGSAYGVWTLGLGD